MISRKLNQKALVIVPAAAARTGQNRLGERSSLPAEHDDPPRAQAAPIRRSAFPAPSARRDRA